MTQMTSYMTAQETVAYANARAIDISEIDQTKLDGFLLRASELLDEVCVFRGTKLQPQQLRAWPRDGVFDESQSPITDIPYELKHICSELAILLANDEEEAMRAIGLASAIQTERVGDIQLRYDGDKGRLPPFLRRLRPYLAEGAPVVVRRA